MNNLTTDGALDALSDMELLELRNHLDTAIAARTNCSGLLPRRSPPFAAGRFSISDDVRRLDKTQIGKITLAFQQWVRESRDARTLRSRKRVFIVFLALRYTGARLGEVLALDENRDIDFENNLILFHRPDGEGVREAPVPEEVVEAVASWRRRHGASQDAGTGREGLFRLDQGFVRRKFYEQELRSGLPRELLNPGRLRTSRAAELLQGGLPVQAVQAMLGYAGSDFISSRVALDADDLKLLVRDYCRNEFTMETSAKNTFHGHVTGVEHNAVMCEVILRTESGHELSAIITNRSREKLGIEVGRPATALVKAAWVALETPSDPPETHAENAFPGVITNIVVDGGAADVQGRLDDGVPVCALISEESLEMLGVAEGDSFLFTFKAMAVIIS